jgi:4-amino-4-deoxy-L-arabinose transferase-like glycosyltransferase
MTTSRAILLILALTAYRVLLLAFDRTDLFVDEAQYWMWSRDLAFGYYSKPPMIAWVIHLTTTLGGSDSRFWIRLSSPLVHGATAGTIMALAKAVTGSSRISAWSGASFVTLPGVALSAVFISTDTFLLLFYTLAALAAARLAIYHAERANLQRSARFGAAPLAIGLGLSTGLGMLSKYAMLYLPATAALAALALPRARLDWRHAVLAALVTLAVMSPNLVWNAQHGGATLRHTSDNIGWSGLHFHLGKALEFIGAQFGVVGPVLFGAMIAALLYVVRRRAGPVERHLVMLSWPIIGLIVLQALMSRAYANWAATAYVAGVVLAVFTLDSHWKKGLRLSLAINGAVSLALPLLCAFPQTHLPGRAPILDRYLGRSTLSLLVAERASAEGLTTIVADNRDILADLVHTLRDRPLEIRARPTGEPPRNAYEQDRTYDVARDTGTVLLVSEKPLTCDVAATTELAPIQPETGFLKGRTLRLYAVKGECLAP